VTVSIIDAQSDACPEGGHHVGLVVPTNPARAAIPLRPTAPPTTKTASRSEHGATR
jgi:hypothetical protein